MSARRWLLGALAACVAIGPARAEPNAQGGPRPAQLPAMAQLAYAGYVAGFNVMNARAGFRLSPDGYALGVSFQTAGMIGALFRGDNLSLAEGAWSGSRPMPRDYLSGGTWRGNPRHVEIAYPDGQPHVVTVVPPEDNEREPVPEAMQRGTVDTLSAVAELLHTVALTGRCEGQARTFDGHRVTEVSAHTVGIEVLPPESRSSFSGPALRCDLEGRQLAGFPKDAGPDDMLRKPQHSSIWVASLRPGMPQVPVLMSFETRFFGHVRLYVTQSLPSMNIAEFTPRVP